MKRAHLRNVQRSIAEAAKQSQIAYEFSPNSYTFWTLVACWRATGALNPPQQTARATARPARLERAHVRSDPESELRPSGAVSRSDREQSRP